MILDSYNDFLRDKITEMFPIEEAKKYAEDSDQPRPITIRTNTLLIKPKDLNALLLARGVELSPLGWCDSAFIIFKSPIPIGASPEYLAGYYSIVGAASLLPVLALDVSPGMSVLDMCAAPGGKSAFIGAKMRNSGTLYCADMCKDRLFGLRANLQRQNIRAILIGMDARKLELGKMDRILLDAPCMGTGVVSKDQSAKTGKSEEDLRKITCTQKELILKGWNMLKEGGVLVYSTCSILTEENEEVIQYLVDKVGNVKIEEACRVGKNGFKSYRGKHFHNDMINCRRVYPHVHNMDGFFVAKLVKQSKI